LFRPTEYLRIHWNQTKHQRVKTREYKPWVYIHLVKVTSQNDPKIQAVQKQAVREARPDDTAECIKD